MCVCVLYLAGAYSTAVKAGFPVFSVASDSLFLWAVAAAARTGRTHAVVASREVHAHAVIPAGVCLQTALIDVWKRESGQVAVHQCLCVIYYTNVGEWWRPMWTNSVRLCQSVIVDTTYNDTWAVEHNDQKTSLSTNNVEKKKAKTSK